MWVTWGGWRSWTATRRLSHRPCISSPTLPWGSNTERPQPEAVCEGPRNHRPNTDTMKPAAVAACQARAWPSHWAFGNARDVCSPPPNASGSRTANMRNKDASETDHSFGCHWMNPISLQASISRLHRSCLSMHRSRYSRRWHSGVNECSSERTPQPFRHKC